MPEAGRRLALALLGAACLWPAAARAALDLQRAEISRLENGLVLAVLEEPALPVVSVQMLYRAGAKHEPLGATGLAHFLEHMAFRSTENFPGTEVVSRIYAVGGEWHGYTWLDQTTYFATVPKQHLDLLLRIEADRMARLEIPADDVEAERGAVLAEMHGYENDPATVLQDHALYLSFLAHPYRNNTIGWESDVAAITHADLIAFYGRHYQPGNAVLAVVGDVDAADVRRRVHDLFSGFAGRPPSPEPRTAEPPQRGERRIRIEGSVAEKHFKMAWRAPNVNHPDYAAFLVLQDWLAGGSGVSFLQNDWGTPARPDSPLGAALPGALSWFPPAQQDYVFTVAGAIPAGADEAAAEAAVQRAIDVLRAQAGDAGPGAAAALSAAQRRVRRELLFDVQTTEDAAHQLAFFAGMDALASLNGLPQALDRVSVAEVGRVADQWLRPEQRTTAWFVPAGTPPAPSGAVAPPIVVPETAPSHAVAPPPARVATTALAPPRTERLPNGLPVVLQTSPLSPTVHLRAVLSAPTEAGASGDPAPGLSTIARDLLPAEWDAAVAELAAALAAPAAAAGAEEPGADPGLRLQQEISALLGTAAATAPQPLLLVVTGDFEPAAALATLAAALGESPVGALAADSTRGRPWPAAVEVELAHRVAQEQLGYLVRAPQPGLPEAEAWRLALYVLSHGYEGRLGKAAISDRGLVYYIDSAYGGDRAGGWVSLGIGVDPDKRLAMQELMVSELARLRQQPPTTAEVDEAREHLLGRCLSAAQSNAELAERLARDWLWYGRPLDCAALAERLAGVSTEDVIGVLPAFTTGTVLTIRGPAH